MSTEFFKTRVPAKWVLTGEHAVLRGETAVALPYHDFALQLECRSTQSSGIKYFPSDSREEIESLLIAIRDQWEDEGKVFPKLEGEIHLTTSIPIGAGLGSSAALCVALTRWLSEPLELAESDYFEFAKQLEHRFHGRSSGMDVAAILTNQPISFTLERGATPLGVKKLPRFTLHDTGVRARTSECVLRVEKIREENPSLGLEIDEKMGQASRYAIEGLNLFDRGYPQALNTLTQAMKTAQECFYSWELVPGNAHRLEQDLYRQGALGVKLTGAGGGGFLVALWPN